MKLLADECCDFNLVQALRADGHDVLSVAESSPGSTDEDILKLSVQEKRILITEDKDFGELVYRFGLPVYGLVLLRFAPRERELKIKRVRFLLSQYGNRLNGSFIVLDTQKIRFRRLRITF